MCYNNIISLVNKHVLFEQLFHACVLSIALNLPAFKVLL